MRIYSQKTGTGGTSAPFRKYIREKIETVIDGFIAEAVDEATGLIAEAATIGNILTIHGYGLKLETAEGNPIKAATFFKPPTGIPTEVTIIAVNEPRTLKVLVPALTVGTPYQLVINTMSSVKSSGHVLNKMRDMRSEFTVTAQS